MQIDIRLYENENCIWIATVPTMPGTVSQGDTEQEALKNIEDAIKGVVAVRTELGWPLTSRVVTLEITS